MNKVQKLLNKLVNTYEKIRKLEAEANEIKGRKNAYDYVEKEGWLGSYVLHESRVERYAECKIKTKLLVKKVNKIVNKLHELTDDKKISNSKTS